MSYLAVNLVRLPETMDLSFLERVTNKILIEKSETGAITGVIPETSTYLHSRYDPVKEANRFAENISSDDTLVVIYGFGFGYHIEAILERVGTQTQVIVFEASLETFRTVLEAKDLPILDDRRLRVVIAEDSNTWIKHLAETIETVEKTDGKFLIHAPSLQGIPYKFADIKRVLLEWKAMTGNKKHRELMMNNLEFHRTFITKAPNIGRFFSKFKNVPGILISAGPSLDKNGHLLSLAKKKALLLSVGTAVKPLLKMGIQPDFILVTDPQPLVAEQMKDLKLDIPLIMFPTVHKSVFEQYTGPKIYAFQRGVEETEIWSKELKYPPVETGGSVATAGLDILIKLGCSPIIFVGQDLAYTNGQSHAKDTIYDNLTFTSGRGYQTEAFGGGAAATSLSWEIYRKWIEQQCSRHPQVSFINATEGGARIHGTTEMSLNTSLSNLHETEDIKENITKILYGGT